MADIKNYPRSNVLPLFDKMDALLARHRGPGGQDIPVLTDEAPSQQPSQSPVLIDAVSNDGMMFDPLEFQSRAPRYAPPLGNSLPPPAPEKVVPLFLDLPTLNLDGLADNPLGIADTFELEIDTPQHEEHVVPQLHAGPVELNAASIEAPVPLQQLATPVFEEATFHLEIDEAVQPAFDEDLLPVLDDEVLLPYTAYVAPAAVIDAPESALPAENVPFTEIEEEIEIGALPDDEEGNEHHLSLAEMPPEHTIWTLEHEAPPAAIETVPLPVAPKLTDDAITEITASVAAQIAVEVSTEVAQLTRQHFASMMNRFYSESLRQLTEEISRDMEMCLAPRIVELVQDELRRQGLAD